MEIHNSEEEVFVERHATLRFAICENGYPTIYISSDGNEEEELAWIDLEDGTLCCGDVSLKHGFKLHLEQAGFGRLLYRNET